MELRGLLMAGEKKLEALTISNPQMEALWLLWSCLGKDRTSKPQDLYFHLSTSAPETLIHTYGNLLQKRLGGVPLPYLLGEQEFMGSSFHVNPNVLIPRQETETLAEEVFNQISKLSSPHILEIGTGSGVLAILIAKKYPDCDIKATDISSEALRIAQENALLHGVKQRITFIESNLFSKIPSSSRFDLIFSNPPYIATNEIPRLQREVQCEPRTALDGGVDGLQIIQPLIHQSQKYLKAGGLLILEIGQDQSKSVLTTMQEWGYQKCEIFKDLSGHDRIVKGVYG